MAMTAGPPTDDPFAGPALPEGPGGARRAADPPVPTMLSAAWEQAEARLYPTVTDRPDLYQRVILLVRATVERLRERGPSTGALLEAADQGDRLVLRAAEETGQQLAELDPALVAQAALAMRYREVRGEQTRLRRLRLLEEARAEGRDWVVLEEAGHSDGDPFVPYRRLEAEVATGRAVLVATAADDDFRAVQHTVRAAQVDLADGAVREADPDRAPAVFADAAARERAVAAVKRSP
jgi:hypothetical protein